MSMLYEELKKQTASYQWRGERQLRLNMLHLCTCFLVFLVSLSLAPDFFLWLSTFGDTKLLIPSLSLTPEIDSSNQWAWFALKFDLFTWSKVLNTMKPKLILKRKRNCKSKTCLLMTSILFCLFTFACLSHNCKSCQLKVFFDLQVHSSPNLLLPRFIHSSKCPSIHSVAKAKNLRSILMPFPCQPIVSLSIDTVSSFRISPIFTAHYLYYQHSLPHCHCPYRATIVSLLLFLNTSKPFFT